MLIAGLTGNFGMGKSFALSVFRDLGAVTLDSDRIVAILLNEEEVIRKVGDLLGGNLIGPDGKLDKKAVAETIFGNSSAKKKLEELLHPLVFERIDDFIARIKNRNCIVIIEVPLLFEGDHDGRFQKIVTVHTSEETAVARLLKSGFSREEALVRLKSQMPIEVKKKRADYTIDNSGTKEETRSRIEEIYRLLIGEMKK